MNYIHVWINLVGPTEQIPDLGISLLFSAQPTVDDILVAWDNDPRLTRREFAANYRAMLVNALNTFGVPNLGAYDLHDEQNFAIAVPRVTSSWNINAMNRRDSLSGMKMGYISVSYLPLNDNRPEPVVPEKSHPLTKVKKPKTKKEKK